jgi:hypothetical protein
MISSVIEEINKGFKKLFETTAGVKIYGLAHTMLRTKGSETELIPALVDHSGEGKYIGIDDTAPVIIYHKSNSITSTIRPSEGFGRDPGGLVNTYNNTLIVYLNRKRLKLLPDELFLFIQAHFPDTFKMDPFTVSIRITNVILNSQQVWASEYQRDFTLPPEANLFAVNYTVESSFKKGCFEKCL